MKLFSAAFCTALLLAGLLACRASCGVSDTIRELIDGPADGAVEINDWKGAPKTIRSIEITSFEAEFLLSHGYARREGDRWVSDEAKNARRPRGRYRFTMKREGEGAAVTADFEPDNGGREQFAFAAPISALDELHKCIVVNGFPEINGFSRWQSALGEKFRLKVLYASGEKIFAYGEGGSSCACPRDLGCFIELFRELCEQYAR